ncbi:MAG TPA: ABC transporter permease subunit [Firmicutes bacterium]|nr:ABC transporter permease subunit [Bacillota bacterium]
MRRPPWAGGRSGLPGMLLILPALAMLAALYIYPLLSSIVMSFVSDAGVGLENYRKAFSLYLIDMLYTVGITILSLAIVFVISVAIAGYLRFNRWPFLNFVYRLPLFIPFLIVGHSMRVFLAPHGILNLILSRITGIPELPGLAFGWGGLVISYVWKQFPLATLLILGAFQSVEDSYIEAALNLGSSRLRVIREILLPISGPTVLVAMVLTFVSTIGCLTIPLLVGAPKPVMLPVDMSFRVTYFNDWGVANALGVISYVIVIVLAYYYLKHMVREEGA